jgi:hypothetical protein
MWRSKNYLLINNKIVKNSFKKIKHKNINIDFSTKK